MKPLLVLRPQPGADETAQRAAAQGLAPLVIPMFEVRAVPWSMDPTTLYDAVFITSSNGLKFIDKNLNCLKGLPILCVGEATADAARRAGLSDVTAGSDGAAALADLAAVLGYRHLLWLAGDPHTPVIHPNLMFDVKII
jgi:uroporphyrinogen-III synthase